MGAAQLARDHVQSLGFTQRRRGRRGRKRTEEGNHVMAQPTYRTGSSLFVSSLCALCALCAKSSGADPKKAARVTYDEHVLPLLREKCLTCHGPDRKSGGLRLNTYTETMAGGSSGAVIKAGDPDGSP